MEHFVEGPGVEHVVRPILQVGRRCPSETPVDHRRQCAEPPTQHSLKDGTLAFDATFHTTLLSSLFAGTLIQSHYHFALLGMLLPVAPTLIFAEVGIDVDEVDVLFKPVPILF